MTQAEFEHEVAETTGESPRTIRRRGFSLLVMPEREPLAIDWDEPPHADAPRPFRRRRKEIAA
ncbi:MAG: hypothetical protein JNM18_14380 [Planctomycetaceae bacterium]|nr:hypothetical protein [Planctomycetaceae bacterium]